MKIWCFNDARFWGRQVYQEAVNRGHDAALFHRGDRIAGGYAFYRMDQSFPFVDKQREHAEKISTRLNLVPDLRMIRHYEDKWVQAQAYKKWMPKTHLITNEGQARKVLEKFPLPFISKSKRGSASKNVRLIATMEAAEKEIQKAFRSGIRAWGGAQRNYLIWQELCPGNLYDYRVNIVGREIAIARRWNKPKTLFASGSDHIDNIDPNEAEAVDVLEFASRFFAEENITFAAIDIVKDAKGRWRLLETSIAWPAHHTPWQTRFFLSGRPCRDLFAVVVEGMEDGVFEANAAIAPAA